MDYPFSTKTENRPRCSGEDKTLGLARSDDGLPAQCYVGRSRTVEVSEEYTP